MLLSKVCFVLCVLGALCAPAQDNVMLPENTTKVSEHVYALIGFPNVAIVVGNRATLVVDTGMGPRNGAIVMRQVEKLAKGPNLYLTTTHYHAEHTSGEQAFPDRTVLIRNQAQQADMDKRVEPFIANFRRRSAQWDELLKDVKLRPPDIVYDREITLDLGGVTARLFWLGTAHTIGDELIFVEPDSALIPGDIVQNKQVPFMNAAGEASVRNWIAILDKLEALKPRFVVPDHGTLGDGSLIGKYRGFFVDLQNRALELKRQGTPVDDAARMVTAEFKTKYPDWGNPNNVGNGVRRVYEESQ
jgi:glyoxylase-like metal-dependent hydrolase (beta-lactamase superfamily II)